MLPEILPRMQGYTRKVPLG
uniref:Uncharacterized protein n=1 Tax=Anguilla anguilla TaxID=7936 RepID=A0A0E9TH53_ANGAN